MPEEPKALAVASHPVMQVLQMAQSPDLDVDKLEKLMDLARTYQEREASVAMQEAHAAFQSECPPIQHNQTAKITTTKGGSYSYTYASLDQVARTIAPYLHAHGLSYTWDSNVDGGLIVCTCTLRHVDGGERTATFTAPMDSSASMSGPQKAAAALTYAKRQALVQVLGLTTADSDTDAAHPEPSGTITEDQARELQALIDEVGAEHGARMLKWARVNRLPDLPADKFEQARATLEKRRSAA